VFNSGSTALSLGKVKIAAIVLFSTGCLLYKVFQILSQHEV